MNYLFSVIITVLFSSTLMAREKLYLMDSVASKAPEAELRAQAVELNTIFDELSELSGVQATLVYSDDLDINAFATEIKGKKYVLVNKGLLTYLENDRDAVAAVLGHELAHHKLDHIHAGNRKKKGVRIFGAVLGAVVGAKLGHKNGNLANEVSNKAVNYGAGLVALKFNRNQEKKADKLSIQWMIEGNYNPRGMLRLQQMMSEMNKGKKRATLLSSHPSSAKRFKTAKKEITRSQVTESILSLPQMPLISELTKSEIKQDDIILNHHSEPEATHKESTNSHNVHLGNNVKVGKGVRIGGTTVNDH